MSSLFGSIRKKVVRFTYFDLLFLNSCTFIYSCRYNLEPIHVYLLHTLLDYTVIVICKGRELWLSPSRTSHQTLARFAELWVPADQPGRGGVRAVLGQPGGEVHHDLRMVHGPLVCSGHLLLGNMIHKFSRIMLNWRYNNQNWFIYFCNIYLYSTSIFGEWC